MLRSSRFLIAVAVVLALAVPAAPAGAQAPTVTTQTFGVNTLLQALHAVNSQVVWAAGNNGVVLRTLDGGAHWERTAAPGGDTLQYRDVHAFSADEAVILSIGAGMASRIYRTADGGKSWALQFLNRDTTAFFDCLSFGSRQQGVVYGDASVDANGSRTNILRTDSGGERWSLLRPNAVPAALPNEGAFAASGQCVVHGDSSTVYIATGAPGARLFRSRDAGKTWTVENTPFVRGTAAGLTGMSFATAMRGLVVGADINKLRTDTSMSVVGFTPDGGRSWQMRARPPVPGALAGVTWVLEAGEETAVVSGYGGAAWTANAGRSWTAINTEVSAGITASGKRAWLGGRGVVYLIEWP